MVHSGIMMFNSGLKAVLKPLLGGLGATNAGYISCGTYSDNLIKLSLEDLEE